MREPNQDNQLERRLIGPNPSYVPAPISEPIVEAQPGNPPFDYVRLVRRYALLGLIFMMLGAVGGVISATLTLPLYKSRAELEVQPYARSIFRTEGGGGQGENGVDLQTEIQLLHSSAFLGRVMQQIQMASIPPTPIKQDLLSRLRRRFGTTTLDPAASAREAFTIAVSTYDARPVNGTRIIEISCDSSNPEIAAAFLNTVATEYSQQNYQNRMESVAATNQWIAQQVEATRTKMLDAEQHLTEFVRSSGNLFVSQESTLADSKLKDLQGQLAAAHVNLLSKQNRYEIIRNAKPDSLPELLDDPQLRQEQARIADLRQQIAVLNLTLTPSNMKVKALETQVTDLQVRYQKELAETVQRITNDYEAARRAESLLNNAYSSSAGQVSNQAGKAAEYNALKRESETLRHTYDVMLQQASEAGIAGSVPINNIRLVEPATPPAFFYKPKGLMYVSLGSILGLVACCALALLREKMDQRVSSPHQARLLLNLPQLGVIPSVEGVKPRWRLFPPIKKGDAPDDGTTIDAMSESESTPAGDESAAKSMLAESFRVVLASLMRETAGFNRPQVILVTSPGPEEGKTTIASNLGRALAETGRRVLVFDADFRRPRAHKVLGVPNTRGLVDLLAETTPMDDYSREDFGVRTAYPHLYVLPNGRRSENIAKALYSSRLRELVLRLRKEFDMVVIDAPPIQAVADARVMSDMTDGIVLVLRSGITDRQSAVDTLNQMRADGLVVLGTVLNDWTPSKSQLKKNYYYTSLNSYDRT